MKRVFVNGYGSIGSRIASFLQDDPRIEVTGVGKYSADEDVQKALDRGLRVYAPAGRMERFGDAASGSIEAALDRSDMVIDASPGGTGAFNKAKLYDRYDLPVIYQGGETSSGQDAVSDFIFNSRINYAEALGRRDAIQGSCNVTGMGRVIGPLREAYGGRMRRIDVTLVRRWADIEQTDKTFPDSIEMTADPHHGADAQSYLGDSVPLYVRAVKVPTRQMHLHIMDVRFDGAAPDPADAHAIFRDERGVAVLQTAPGTREVREFAGSMGFHFTDTNMIHIHAGMTASRGDTLQIMYSDDQTGIVIPENHMLMQAMLFGVPRSEAVTRTDGVFRMAERKERLEKHFS